MICTSYNQHTIKLLHSGEILWRCILSDDTSAISDFDIEDQKDPWTRLKIYCHNNNLNITEVKVICPGMPEETIFEDKNGLDNFFISRGISKDITNNDTMTYKYMCFGILKDDNKIHVKKFHWPEFALAQNEEIRELTLENDNLMYKQKKRCKENCKCQSKEQT
jgi:hypothetical protein